MIELLITLWYILNGSLENLISVRHAPKLRAPIEDTRPLEGLLYCGGTCNYDSEPLLLVLWAQSCCSRDATPYLATSFSEVVTAAQNQTLYCEKDMGTNVILHPLRQALQNNLHWPDDSNDKTPSNYGANLAEGGSKVEGAVFLALAITPPPPSSSRKSTTWPTVSPRRSVALRH